MQGAGGSTQGLRPATIYAAAAITVLDGFDSLCLPLVAPLIAVELHLSPVQLGLLFSSTLAGTIAGASAGGFLADRLGRLQVLMIACFVFGAAALLMPFMTSGGGIIINRLAAGIGLGAAAPIGVALLARSSAKPPSDLAISLVWMGIAAGGILAAAFNYLIVGWLGWRSVFVVGGLLPIPAALFAFLVFRGDASGHQNDTMQQPGVADLLATGRLRLVLLTAAMFLLGYVVSATALNWLPTILHHRAASPFMVSSTFLFINVGSLGATIALGLIASRTRSPAVLGLSWLSAGVVTITASFSTGTIMLAFLAVVGATLACGAQAISVAFASRISRGSGLESTTIGLMVCAGRIGQVSALSVSGVVIARGLPEQGVFALAGTAACIAAGIGYLAANRQLSTIREAEQFG